MTIDIEDTIDAVKGSLGSLVSSLIEIELNNNKLSNNLAFAMMNIDSALDILNRTNAELRSELLKELTRDD